MTATRTDDSPPARPRIADLPLAEQRQADRHEYLRFTAAANRLRVLSRISTSFAVETAAEHDPDLYTFAVGVGNFVRRQQEQAAEWYAEQAVTAQELADHYRARLDGDLQ